MADQGGENRATKPESTAQNGTDSGSNIHDFVTQQYQKQRQEAGDVPIDQDRINNFFARAVSESNRMSNEVVKAHDRLTTLHTEFGEEIFTEWRQEHCAQVLDPHQAQLIEQAAQKTAEEMDQS